MRLSLKLLLIGLLVLLHSPPAVAQSFDDDLMSSAEPPHFVYERDPKVQANVRKLLKDPGYRFCRDPNYRLFEAEKRSLCPQVSEVSAVCPELVNACNRPSWEAVAEEDESWFDWDFLDWFDWFDLPSLNIKGAAGLLKLLFWIALAVGVGLLIRALIRQAQLWKEERDQEKEAAPVISAEPSEDLHEELQAEQLFRMAKEALEKNHIAESLHLTYRATVRALSDAEWVKPHKSKTSGDYQRGLRKLEAADLDLPVSEARTHLRELDRERFRNTPEAQAADGLLQRALSLAARLAQTSSILLSLLLTGCEPPTMPEFPNQPKAPLGGQLFEDLMKASGANVHRRLFRVTEIPDTTSSVVSVNASLRELEWRTLRTWVENGGHLVVADPDPIFFEMFSIDGSTQPCDAPLVAPDLSLVKFYQSRYLSGGEFESWSVARCGEEPIAVSNEYGSGWLTIVADGRLFENVTLAAGDNATLVMSLVGDVYGHVQYLGPWTGRGAHHPLQSISRAGFGWWVIHVLLLGLIYAWSRGKRFGTPQDPPEEKRRHFSEHARALSLKYEKSGASGWALRNYAEWVLDSLRKRAPSTKADLKSLTRAVSSTNAEGAKLREALTTARRADELGDTSQEHQSTFLRLKSALLGLSEVSRRRTSDKE